MPCKDYGYGFTPFITLKPKSEIVAQSEHTLEIQCYCLCCSRSNLINIIVSLNARSVKDAPFTGSINELYRIHLITLLLWACIINRNNIQVWGFTDHLKTKSHMVMVISDWTGKNWHVQWLPGIHWLFHIKKVIWIPGDLHSVKTEDNGDGLPVSQMPYYMDFLFAMTRELWK